MADLSDRCYHMNQVIDYFWFTDDYFYIVSDMGVLLMRMALLKNESLQNENKP